MKQNGISVGIPFAIIGEGVEHRNRGSDDCYKEWFLPDGRKRVSLFDTENGFVTDAHIPDAMIPDIKAGKLVLFDEFLETDSGGSHFRRDVKAFADEQSLSEEDRQYIERVKSTLKKNGTKFFPEPEVVYDTGWLGYAFGRAANALYVGTIFVLGTAARIGEIVGPKKELPPSRPDQRREP